MKQKEFVLIPRKWNEYMEKEGFGCGESIDVAMAVIQAQDKTFLPHEIVDVNTFNDRQRYVYDNCIADLQKEHPEQLL